MLEIGAEFEEYLAVSPCFTLLKYDEVSADCEDPHL